MATLTTWRIGRMASTFAFVVLIGLAHPRDATALPIDSIRLSRIASITTAEIELGCAMRYLDHTAFGGGTELRVRLALGYDCINALRSTRSAIHRPPGRRMAYLSTVEFETIAASEAIISLYFERPVSFDVRQTSNQYLLTISVDTDPQIPIGEPVAMPPTTAATAPKPDLPRNSGLSRVVQRALPRDRDRFVLRLSELSELGAVEYQSLSRFDSSFLYANTVLLNGREWRELRLGFFETEAAAMLVLNDLRSVFPSAWISIATPDEQAMAKKHRLSESEDGLRSDAALVRPPVVSSAEQLVPLPADRVAALMADAKDALLRGDFGQSSKIYTRLLQQAEGSHRQTAREFLGVARQKNGQVALAKAEFESYLSEFPDAPGARRVQQRLATLAAATSRPDVQSVVRQVPHQSTNWNFDGAVSQYYFRGVNLTRDDEPDVLSQSELLSQANFSASRRGDRFDLLLRGNVGYLHEFMDNDSGSQARSSYLYFDIRDNELDIEARLGRQTQHRAGVPGRFDGMHVGYGLWRNLEVAVTAGFPVDSPRFLADPKHYFYGASAGLNNIAEVLDVSVFTNLQTIDGIPDRRAIGADAQYNIGRLNIFGLVDYDASYNVINNALIVGNWRVNDRLTFNGRYQGGAGPFLTTRNAIIGQPVNTIDALMETYSEGQLRRLARNRTAQVRFGSAGLSAQLSQRWHLNADINYSEYGSTIASGGVAAFPATGPQYIYSGQLLGSSLLKAGDSIVFSFRHRKTRDSDANTAILDMRFPLGDGLRINPRLAVTLEKNRRSMAGEAQQWIANPMLRVYYSWRGRYRIEFEVGGHWSDQELPTPVATPAAVAGSIETSLYYLQLGYSMDFR